MQEVTKPKFWVPPKLENLTRIRKPKAERAASFAPLS